MPIQILGINEVGHESGNETFTDGRDLPWLQEVEGEPIWDLWNITYRDVVILDGQHQVVAIYNLTDNDLAEPTNYDALGTLLLDAADGN